MIVTSEPDSAAPDPAGEARNVVVTPEQALQIAVDLHQRGHREKAERLYREILARAPDNAAALHFLGIARHQDGDDDAALVHLTRALELAPDDPGLWLNYGNVLVETGAGREAIPAYRRAAELMPGNPQPYNNLGVVLRAVGAPEHAEEAFRRAIELAPTQPHAHHNLGNLLLGLGRASEAIESGLRALTLIPDKVDRKVLGTAYAYLGDIESARRTYQEWLAEDPENPLPAHYLAALGETPPARASDGYVEQTFDSFASSFDSKLAHLEYRAPKICADALIAAAGGRTDLDILDAGCGTGLCGPYLKPIASRLSGIDLSGKMLARAKARKCYDRLRRIEIVSFLEGTDERYDAILSADTLCYFGALEAFAAAAAKTLAPGGILVATFEASADQPDAFELAHTGRYRHGRRYLERTMTEPGLTVEALAEAVLRTEHARPVDGFVLTARRPAQA